MNKITHYCPTDGESRELKGDWKELSEELRAVCKACGPVYANENGVEHA